MQVNYAVWVNLNPARAFLSAGPVSHKESLVGAVKRNPTTPECSHLGLEPKEIRLSILNCHP